MKKKFEENFEYLLYWISLAVIMLLLTCSAVIAQPTRKEVLNYILNHTNIICPEVVFKQAVMETNCGKTGVGATKNNLFGFKLSGSYMYFKTWEESVCYYEQWQKKRLYKYLEIKPPGDIDYYHFLWYIGYNDGKKYGQQGKIYIDKLKNLSVKL
jgi:hypothetical protein